MAQVLIRNLDDDVVASLKRKAESAGLSLEAFLRDTLTRQTEPTRAELVAEIEALRMRVNPPTSSDPLAGDIVREMRDERTRQQAKLHGLLE
jgi:plasmid stability protein